MSNPKLTPAKKTPFKKMSPDQEAAEVKSLDIDANDAQEIKAGSAPNYARPENPIEGTQIVLANGDIETFQNGAWIVRVQANPHTGQDSQL